MHTVERGMDNSNCLLLLLHMHCTFDFFQRARRLSRPKEAMRSSRRTRNRSRPSRWGESARRRRSTATAPTPGIELHLRAHIYIRIRMIGIMYITYAQFSSTYCMHTRACTLNARARTRIYMRYASDPDLNYASVHYKQSQPNNSHRPNYTSLLFAALSFPPRGQDVARKFSKLAL